MELWIRSQNRLQLVKVNYCYIMEQTDYCCIVGETIDSGPLIGRYKTKERALEVLDEIQNIVVDYKEMSRVVYEMPKE